ncbi:iron-sulfur cluster assembly accessory protein [Catenulispora acidiphila]|uniref:adhesin n=1 Tax=Catenulispora acidiphila TaxID=304895 RepID=UPI00019DF327|nr:adhesin [Catenulispora acidiphila]
MTVQHLEDVVLSLTDRAAAAIQVLTTSSELPPETAGLRIVAADPSLNGNQDQFSAVLATGPDAGDQVVESGPARIFLESTAATVLDGRELDATVDVDGSVKFVVGPGV